jgi:hypothetical protein
MEKILRAGQKLVVDINVECCESIVNIESPDQSLIEPGSREECRSSQDCLRVIQIPDQTWGLCYASAFAFRDVKQIRKVDAPEAEEDYLDVHGF